MSEIIVLEAKVGDKWAGMRLDQIAALAFSDYSRSRLKLWILAGELTVDGQLRRPRDKLHGGENLQVRTVIQHQQLWQPQSMELDIVYEDDVILVLNKPAGLVVHPAAGHQDGTLLNALLNHCPQLALLPRAGIVHRLDKDTTGLMVIAKSISAHTGLVAQLQERSMGREYEAIAVGLLTGGGQINAALGRHARNRQKMAVTAIGKQALTYYRVLKQFRAHTYIRLQLETGRTHQIRVHMAHIRYPLVGDPLYGGRLRLPKGITTTLQHVLRDFGRQALHARKLQLCHPQTGDTLEWTIGLPTDFQQLLQQLVLDASVQDDLP